MSGADGVTKGSSSALAKHLDQAPPSTYRGLVTVVNVGQAKTRLSELLALVESGEDVIVARAGVPIARLVPIEPHPRREFGRVPLQVPRSFFEPLPEGELAGWE